MKVIAVSQRVDHIPGREETRDALDQRLPELLIAAELLAIPVPNSLYTQQWLEAIKPDGIILSGGNDIGKIPTRDVTEKAMLDFAEHRRLPVLGICRGMQMLGIHAGCRLKDLVGHVGRKHNVSGKIRRVVNSFHHFGIDACPTAYEVLATSEDGEIEAIRHRNLPWEGWMWHPEREVPFHTEDIRRIKDLFHE